MKRLINAMGLEGLDKEGWAGAAMCVTMFAVAWVSMFIFC